MSKLRMPYQCLQKCGNILIAARGSSIDSFSLDDCSLLSSWKCPTPFQDLKISEPSQDSQKPAAEASLVPVDPTPDSSSPPAKKRKLSATKDTEDTEKPATKGSKDAKDAKDAKKANNRANAVASGLEAPAVIALAVKGQHVVAVTGEDKSIRVFENILFEGKQSLKHISQRAMPKRPCSLKIAHDSTIISADKFGDVFSLPLLYEESKETTAAQTPEPTTKASFVPSANNFTVHSQRNRQALEHQKRHSNKLSPKENPVFEHKLLLGHVSMLTDVLLTELNGRNYIITADRDEHIRISRGIPQSHIIEGFCLGHTEFISRLCVPKDRPTILISGGGDDDLFVWEWNAGSLLSKNALKTYVNGLDEVVQDISVDSAETSEVAAKPQVAVSSILHVRKSGDDLVIVACEGVPALFVFLLTPENNLQHVQSLRLTGNALSVISDEKGGLIVSTDNVHQPGSTTEVRDKPSASIEEPSIQIYSFENRILVKQSAFPVVADEEDSTSSSAMGRLTNLLYNLENLRKREDAREEE